MHALMVKLRITRIQTCKNKPLQSQAAQSPPSGALACLLSPAGIRMYVLHASIDFKSFTQSILRRTRGHVKKHRNNGVNIFAIVSWQQLKRLTANKRDHTTRHLQCCAVSLFVCRKVCFDRAEESKYVVG